MIKFKDELVVSGEIGRQDACRLRMGAVTEYIRGGEVELHSDLTIIVRVYANFKDLGRVYKNVEILPQASDLELFVRGFNKGHPLADCVDIGQGKECSDEKIRGQWTLRNVCCLKDAIELSRVYRDFQTAYWKCPLQARTVSSANGQWLCSTSRTIQRHLTEYTHNYGGRPSVRDGAGSIEHQVPQNFVL